MKKPIIAVMLSLLCTGAFAQAESKSSRPVKVTLAQSEKKADSKKIVSKEEAAKKAGIAAEQAKLRREKVPATTSKIYQPIN